MVECVTATYCDRVRGKTLQNSSVTSSECRIIIDREVLSVNIVIEPVSVFCFFFVSTCAIKACYNKI